MNIEEGDMRCKRIIGLLAVSGLLLAGWAAEAGALVLTGYFPAYQGRYWNFSTPGEKLLSTWAINGTFTERAVGGVFILQQDNCRFLSMREEWSGLYMCGEYEPDKYLVPEKPILFLPREIDPDNPVRFEVNLSVFSMPGGKGEFRETGKLKRAVTISLAGVEDMTWNNQELRNCAVLERRTQDEAGAVVEKIWLAPAIGPVKRTVKQGTAEKIYTMVSCAGSETRPAKDYPTRDYFPLNAGTTLDYQSHDNTPASIEIQKQEKIDQWNLTPCVFNIPESGSPNDTFYYAFTRDGLVLPQIFRSAMRSITAFLPPQAPVAVLPAALKIGAFSTSTAYPRMCKYPSRTPNLDFTMEMQCASIPVAVEDVSVPAGEFKDCVKICLFNISRAFEFKMEKVRVGFEWLAKGKGIVKLQQVEYGIFFLPERSYDVSGVQLWELKKQLR
jgi:hypothetical protein